MIGCTYTKEAASGESWQCCNLVHNASMVEIVAGTATRAGIAEGNRWGTGTGSTVETPAKPVPQLGVHGSPDG